MHEASLYKRNSFITLTYNDENLPQRGQLTHKHFQDFMKRLRRREEPKIIRYYMGGEYGDLESRPHYHAILFNKDFDDRKYFKKTGSGEDIDTSEELASLWDWGFTSVGDATFESAAYIARYCLQKRTGPDAEEHYKRYDHMGEYQLNPEYNRMSTNGGIGKDWYKFYGNDVHTYDYIVVNGKETNVPAYYDRLLKRKDPELMRDFKEAREYAGYRVRDDNTPERLAVKEQVALAKIKLLKREL